MKNTTTVSSPGKLMLFGEHAVVYGYPCIATAVDQRMKVTVTRLEEPVFEVEAVDVDIHGYKKPLVEVGKGDIPKGAKFIEIALQNFLQKYPNKGGVRVETSSEFSSQFGFGSSSASTVCTVKALSELFTVNLTPKDIFDISYKTVLDIQGKGSGFDVAAAIYGGTVYFITGGKTIEPLDIKELPLIVGYTGVKADTTTLIKQVAEKKEKYPDKVDRIFQAIGKIVDEAKQRVIEGPARNASASVAGGDWERVGKLMDFNQEYLRDLGVSTQKLEDLISAAKKAGAYGAKLSGAGGGDCMICLAPKGKEEEIKEALKKAGGEVIDVSPNTEGVRVDLSARLDPAERAGRQGTTDDQSELFIVVDKDDNVIGFRTRFDCHHDKSLIHRTTGVAVFDDQGRVLLQKRSKTKDLQPGLWAISVSGHVAKGQTYEEAAGREVKEELGVTLPITFQKKFLLATDRETEMSAIFSAQSNGPFKPNPTEVDEVRFVAKGELSRLMLSREIILTTWAQESLKQIGFLP